MIRSFCGWIIAGSVLFSTVLGLLGVWEFIPGDTAWKLFGTAIVIGGGAVAASITVKAFFGDAK